jgi:hypothetical protein
MKITKKLCDGLCGELRVIWKNDKGKRYCQQCWSAHKSTTTPKPTVRQKRLPSRSPRRIKEQAEYSKIRVPFLEEHPKCQAHLTGICTHHATDVHHKAGRSGELYLNQKYWLAVCRACHMWIETHPIQAREMGLSLSKGTTDGSYTQT